MELMQCMKQWTLGRHQFQEITSYSKPHTEMHARLLVTSLDETVNICNSS